MLMGPSVMQVKSKLHQGFAASRSLCKKLPS